VFLSRVLEVAAGFSRRCFLTMDGCAGGLTRNYKVSFRTGRVTLFESEYSAPGIYAVTLDAPHRRQFSTVRLQMVNEHGQL